MSTKKMFSGAVIALSLIASICIMSSCGAAIDKLIDKMVSETNKQCPMRIDSDMRLDNLKHPEKGILEYSYTLINLAEEDLVMTTEQAASVSKAGITELLKNTTVPELKTILKLKATFRYTFHDKNGKLLFSFDITPEEYT